MEQHDDDGPRAARRRLETRDAELGRGWGDTFVESDAFTNYVGAGSSARVEVAGVYETRAAMLDGMQTRAPVDTGDGIVVPYLYSPPVPNSRHRSSAYADTSQCRVTLSRGCNGHRRRRPRRALSPRAR
jgi:hypothetical protein